jgi:hypothetical protein
VGYVGLTSMADDPHDEVVPQKLDTASLDDLSPVALDGTTTSERRRPGRMEEVSAGLVPLLRGESLENPGFPEARANDLDSARGLIVSIGTGLAVWILSVVLFYMIYIIITHLFSYR